MAGTYHPDGGTTLPCDARIAGEGAGAWGGRLDTRSHRPRSECRSGPRVDVNGIL